MVLKATSDIGSGVPPTPPVPPAQKTVESEGPGRPRRLVLFILRNLNYLQEVGVLLGIGAGAVYFILNLMVNSKLEGVEAKLEKLDAKLERTNTQLDKRLNDMDMKVDKVESRFIARMDNLESGLVARMDKMDAKLSTLIENQRRRDLVTFGSSVLISILATSFLKVELR